MMMRSLLFVATAMFLTTPGLTAQAACTGCRLEFLTYPTGFFMGAMPTPGVGATWQPLPGSTHGVCNGVTPNCNEAAASTRRGGSR